MASPDSTATSSKPKGPEDTHRTTDDNAKPLGDSALPMANFKFTTFFEVKPIIFPRDMSPDPKAGTRKPAGWYPQMTDDEDDDSPPDRKKRKTAAVALDRQMKASGIARWTEDEDIFAFETWAAWPECSITRLTELLNDKFRQDRSAAAVKTHYAGKRKCLFARLDTLTVKGAPSMDRNKDLATEAEEGEIGQYPSAHVAFAAADYSA